MEYLEDNLHDWLGEQLEVRRGEGWRGGDETMSGARTGITGPSPTIESSVMEGMGLLQPGAARGRGTGEERQDQRVRNVAWLAESHEYACHKRVMMGMGRFLQGLRRRSMFPTHTRVVHGSLRFLCPSAVVHAPTHTELWR